MRLGQIARKLSISSSEILGYLATRNIIIEDNPNSRVEQDYVKIIFQKFAPALLETLDVRPEPEVIPPPVKVPVVDVEEPLEELAPMAEEAPDVSGDLTGVAAESVTELPSEALTEDSEVIKAPKVALSGLKVLDNIDLPEPKKKETEVPENVQEIVPRDEVRKPYQQRRQPREQRPYNNPIAQQREREMNEELERRKEKAEKDKERRTQNYLKKVTMSPPTRAVRLIDEPLEQWTKEDIEPKKKSWFGKIIHWLST